MCFAEHSENLQLYLDHTGAVMLTGHSVDEYVYCIVLLMYTQRKQLNKNAIKNVYIGSLRILSRTLI